MLIGRLEITQSWGFINASDDDLDKLGPGSFCKMSLKLKLTTKH